VGSRPRGCTLIFLYGVGLGAFPNARCPAAGHLTGGVDGIVLGCILAGQGSGGLPLLHYVRQFVGEQAPAFDSFGCELSIAKNNVFTGP